MSSPAGDVLAESRATALRWLRATRRRIPEIVLGVGLALTALAVLALAGSVLDDVRIAGHRGVAPATVLDGSSYWRTVVRFTDEEGQQHTPGVLYPSGLDAGQNIYVEYDATEPERVRVAGRNATAGLLPLGAGLVVLWAVVGTAVVRLRRRRDAAVPPSAEPAPAES